MVAISRSRTKLWIVAADTVPSTLSLSVYSSGNTSGFLAGEIKSYSKTGGEDDVESDPVFGGYVDKEKPTSQFELSFEIVPDIDVSGDQTGKLEWESLIYAENNSDSIYTTKGSAGNKAIFIQATDGTNSKAWGFNNANAVSLDMEHSADDNQTLTLNFKFSPTDSSGVPNFQYKADTVTNLKTFSSLATS